MAASTPLRAEAENRVSSCMSKAGFDYVPFDPEAAGWAVADGPIDGIDDRQYRSREGFGVVRVALVRFSPVALNVNDVAANRLPPNDQEAFWDTHSVCAESSYRSIEERSRLVGEVMDEYRSLEAIYLSQQGKPLLVAWRNCMKAGGLGDMQLVSQDAVKSEIVQMTQGLNAQELKSLQTLEIRVALQDLECRTENPRWGNLQAQIEREVAESQKARLAQIDLLSIPGQIVPEIQSK